MSVARRVPVALVLGLLAAATFPLPTTVADDDVPSVSLRVDCRGRPMPHVAMEWTASGGSCWMHGGHHTYDLLAHYTLEGAIGNLVSVEQQFSPPTEFTDPPFDSAVTVQVSSDGQSWTDIHYVSYDIVNLPGEGSILPTRQSINFELEAHDTPFRYIRLHQPASTAAGLSGFMDRSHIIMDLQEAQPPKMERIEGTFAFSCLDGDIMEDIFPEHPCTFGGINRYDTASFFHTYILGNDSKIERLSGSVSALPWRTDDWFIPLLDIDQTVSTQVFVQVSEDGQVWTNVTSVPMPVWGVPASFNVTFDEPIHGMYVRYLPDRHPRFDDKDDAPSLHHLEAFLTYSDLQVDGAIRVPKSV